VTIVWSSEARRSLRAIRKFIAQDSEFYAARFIAKIISRVERVADSPTQGHRVHEYPEEPLREVHESPYRIIYRPSAGELQVVTIVHFKRRLGRKKMKSYPTPAKNHNLLRSAIKARAILRFVYSGQERTVEPQTYGLSKSGLTSLRAYQTPDSAAGPSEAGLKIFSVTKMSNLRKTGEAVQTSAARAQSKG
jgi:toxin ParE1/3/4